MTRGRTPPALFLSFALLVIGVCWLIVRSQAFTAHPEVMAWAVTFDLTLTVPLLYWLFIVRTGRAGMLTVVPVFLISLLIATAVVPRSQQDFLADLRLLALPLEVLLAIALVERIRRGEGRVAEAVRSEINVLYYALFTWRDEPEPQRGRVVTVHERNGWRTVVACILVLLAAESIALHLLLQLWSVKVAWFVTFLDVWGMLWLLGDLQGLKLRRSAITAEAFELRYGLRWSATIPRTNIASVDPVRDLRDWKRRDVLKMAILDEPRWLITLREPMEIRGMAGLRKMVRAIAILPDDDDVLRALSD